ncbi:hypothetical protein CLV60_13522 [Dyadobacter jiangsuensis]|uniref:Uncharacterized protein n=1 Tax=Dyadobacter jiangsuensis TaxID=1591085 RepID=A0A2P8F7T9_9BACT|nr:hypothetical protein CLV60_13522 [Dyadobacter jiangsuensis]
MINVLDIEVKLIFVLLFCSAIPPGGPVSAPVSEYTQKINFLLLIKWEHFIVEHICGNKSIFYDHRPLQTPHGYMCQ